MSKETVAAWRAAHPNYMREWKAKNRARWLELKRKYNKSAAGRAAKRRHRKSEAGRAAARRKRWRVHYRECWIPGCVKCEQIRKALKIGLTIGRMTPEQRARKRAVGKLYRERRAAGLVGSTAACSECGASFVRSYRQLTCSSECRQKRSSRLQAERRGHHHFGSIKPRTCPVCHNDFTPKLNCKFLCSPGCYNIWREWGSWLRSGGAHRDAVRVKAQALAAGSNTYFTGRPCKHGHVSPRFVKGGSCVECWRGFVLTRAPSLTHHHGIFGCEEVAPFDPELARAEAMLTELERRTRQWR